MVSIGRLLLAMLVPASGLGIWLFAAGAGIAPGNRSAHDEAPAHAAAANGPKWTSGPRPVRWVVPWRVGDGKDRVAEVSSQAQGGDPPALAQEPATIETVNGNYVEAQWIVARPAREDQGEAKFRIVCNMSAFGVFDPIVYPGQAQAGHHHTFFGNMHPHPSSDYTALRNDPASSCSGGPLNATLYWEPSLMFEVARDTFVPLRPNVIAFYYREDYTLVPQLYRLLNGMAFIGGVDPADRMNTRRLNEIPGGKGWDKSRRYNGWEGWQCVKPGMSTPITLAKQNSADATSPFHARQLVNKDGSDPWAGACEGPDKLLIANVQAPDCWDGYNLHSPDGRSHVRYSIRKANDSASRVCPDGWWRIPTFVAKVEFANGTAALGGHAWRSRLHLSSDRMDPDPARWQPPGSTFHFDWMNGWSRRTMNTWLKWCLGVTINGDPGHPLTCNDSTISAEEKMVSSGRSPDTRWSNDPVVQTYNYAAEPTERWFGPRAPDTAPMPGHHMR